MTINRTYDTITFWEVKNHTHYILKGRVEKGQEKYMEAYLSTTLTLDEQMKINKIRSARRTLDMSKLSGDDSDMQGGAAKDVKMDEDNSASEFDESDSSF